MRVVGLCHFDGPFTTLSFDIVISSNSTLPIMKRNRNGISLFLKRKITGPRVGVVPMRLRRVPNGRGQFSACQ